MQRFNAQENKWPHLSKPPIVEAIFDLQYRLKDGFEFSLLKPMLDTQFLSIYPKFQQQNEMQFAFKVQPGGAEVDGKANAGSIRAFMYSKTDDSELIQIRQDGFSLNILNTYQDFDSHLKTFMKHWAWILLHIQIQSMTRIANRVINRISIPLDEREKLQKFFNFLPPKPAATGALLSGLLVQQRLRFPDAPDIEGIVTFMHEPIQGNMLPLIFDIDIFEALSDSISDEDAKSKFTDLRHYKNRVFFTGTTADLYNRYI